MSLVSSKSWNEVEPQSKAGSLCVSITLFVGTEKVTVVELPSSTETVLGEKDRELIVAVVQGSVTVISKTVLSESAEGVKVVEPAGPLDAIVRVLLNLTV